VTTGPVTTGPGAVPDAPAPPAVERIAVVRALPGLGDLLCAVPALRALRTRWPTAHVTLVGLPAAAWFVSRYAALVDDLLVAAGVAGLPEIEPDRAALADFRAAAVASRFDLALQLHGSGGASNPLTALLGARHQVSAFVPGGPRPAGTAVPYLDGLPEVERLLTVTRAAGAPDAGLDLAFPLAPGDRDAARRLLRPGPGGRDAPARGYACLHPGASRPANRWDPAAFAAVGDHLAARGLQVVITGTAAERDIVADVTRRRRGPSLALAGRTSVGSLAAVFAGAALVVSNDTGAAHLASAVRAPSVTVFAPGGDPVRWAPLDRERHRAVVPEVAPACAWPSVVAVLGAVDAHLHPAAPPASASPEVLA
jgi:ADP-heptose:LPS heptosyltransferase